MAIKEHRTEGNLIIKTSEDLTRIVQDILAMDTNDAVIYQVSDGWFTMTYNEDPMECMESVAMAFGHDHTDKEIWRVDGLSSDRWYFVGTLDEVKRRINEQVAKFNRHKEEGKEYPTFDI